MISFNMQYILHSVEIAILFSLFFYETTLLFRLTCDFFFDVAALTSPYLPLCDLCVLIPSLAFNLFNVSLAFASSATLYSLVLLWQNWRTI